MVRAKVATGEYAGESDVIGEGLRALEDETDEWLRTRVAAVYDRMASEPGLSRSLADVRRALSGEPGRTV